MQKNNFVSKKTGMVIGFTRMTAWLFGGVILGLISVLNAKSILRGLVILLIYSSLLKEFVCLAKRKNNFGEWMKGNWKILLGLGLGLGWLVNFMVFGGYNTAFLLSMIIFTPMAAYVVRKGE